MIAIFDPDDPRVLSGEYDIYGFTAKELKAKARKERGASLAPRPPTYRPRRRVGTNSDPQPTSQRGRSPLCSCSVLLPPYFSFMASEAEATDLQAGIVPDRIRAKARELLTYPGTEPTPCP